MQCRGTAASRTERNHPSARQQAGHNIHNHDRFIVRKTERGSETALTSALVACIACGAMRALLDASLERNQPPLGLLALHGLFALRASSCHIKCRNARHSRSLANRLRALHALHALHACVRARNRPYEAVACQICIYDAACIF